MAKVKVYVMPRSGIGHIDEFHTDDTHNGEELYHLLQQRFGDGGLWNPKGKPVPSQSMRKMDFGVYKYYLCTAEPNNFTEASMEDVRVAIYQHSYPLMNGHVIAPVPPLPSGAQPWRPFRHSDYPNNANREGLAEHITLQMRGMGVKMGPGGYKVVDVLGNKRLLQLIGGDMWFRGTVDFAVVPFNVSEKDAGKHIRVGILFKGNPTAPSRTELQGPCELQDKYTLQAARHPEALMALLAVATRGGRCDIVVIDGMCFDLLRFRDGKRYLVYNNLKGEQACFAISEALKADSMSA